MHVSELDYTRIENVEDVLKEGDKVQVKLLEIDAKTGKLRLSRKVLLPKPEGYVERPERPERPQREFRGDRPRRENNNRGERREFRPRQERNEE